MSTRKINMYSTSGKINKEGYSSNASTLAELKKELTDMGIDLKNKSITDFTNQKEFTNEQDLPLGDLQLYILPANVKSGKSCQII